MFIHFIKTFFLQCPKHLALPVRFSELQEADRIKSVQEGSPIVLSCELSHDPTADVNWYKDGMELLPHGKQEIKSDGLTRTLLIQSAESIHGGNYECSTADDTITFKVDVKGDIFLTCTIFLLYIQPQVCQCFRLVLWCEW